MADSNDQWGSANLQDFTINSPQTQQEKKHFFHVPINLLI